MADKPPMQGKKSPFPPAAKGKKVKPAKGQPKSQAQAIMRKMMDADKDGM